MMMMATGLLMTSSLLSLSSASGYELDIVDSFQPTKGSIIGTIEIGEEMHFRMDVTIHSIPSGWASIFHCGTSDSIRMPGIWLYSHSGTDGAFHEGFTTIWSHDDNGNDFDNTEYFNLGQTYHLEIDIMESSWTVTQDGVVQFSKSKGDHTTYDSMVCYASNPWYPAADVTVSNIVVWSGAEPTTTGEPTEDPSVAPTKDPSVAPTEDPSVAPTSDPTAKPSMEPTSDPTRDCSVFHIDEFLMDCSVEFDGHDTNIRALQDDVSSVTTAMEGNAVDIATLQATVANLVTAATTMADSIDKINDELALVIEALDRMGDWP
jgi:hypothetical protein